jgi:hypothetical protein
MTPTQRAAAKRLAKELASVHPLHPYAQMCGSAAALLRELAAEPDDVPELVKVRRQLFAAEPVVTECADNDSPWLVCKTCAAAGKCVKEAEQVQKPVAWGVFVDDELFKPFNCKDEAVDWFQAQYNHGSRYDYLVLPLYAAPQQPMHCPKDGGECGAGGYCRPEPVQRKPSIEPFVVRHYAFDERSSIKGNGFDGLAIGEDREEAECFIKFVNAAIKGEPT